MYTHRSYPEDRAGSRKTVVAFSRSYITAVQNTSHKTCGYQDITKIPCNLPTLLALLPRLRHTRIDYVRWETRAGAIMKIENVLLLLLYRRSCRLE
jgi:hypothetical protein